MLLENGPGALGDAALLAILLRTDRQGQSAIDLAREMMSKFGRPNGFMYNVFFIYGRLQQSYHKPKNRIESI